MVPVNDAPLLPRDLAARSDDDVRPTQKERVLHISVDNPSQVEGVAVQVVVREAVARAGDQDAETAEGGVEVPRVHLIVRVSRST